MEALLHSDLSHLPPPRQGKVRDVYDLGDSLLIVTTDRISAFDVVMANGIPQKGQVLNQLSLFWFDKLSGVCPNHVLSSDEDTIEMRSQGERKQIVGRTILARKAVPFPVECVVRGYICGSLFKDYQAEGRGVHGLDLPEGLVNGSRLADPIFTPATKAETGHDENISFDQMVDIVGAEVAHLLRNWSMTLYQMAASYALEQGLIIADTKFEFGQTDDGVLLIDEALTPDSSRFWDAFDWQPGQAQPSFDKQFVRDYLESIKWNKEPPGPELPAEVVQKTRDKYIQAYESLTGQALRL